MSTKRNIGHEILEGVKEITVWRRGEKKLKVTKVSLPDAESTLGSKSFEDLKQINQYGAEYWSARDLQPLLGYTQWRRFEQAVERAKTSCEQSGNPSGYHFAGAGKMIDFTSNA